MSLSAVTSAARVAGAGLVCGCVQLVPSAGAADSSLTVVLDRPSFMSPGERETLTWSQTFTPATIESGDGFSFDARYVGDTACGITVAPRDIGTWRFFQVKNSVVRKF